MGNDCISASPMEHYRNNYVTQKLISRNSRYQKWRTIGQLSKSTKLKDCMTRHLQFIQSLKKLLTSNLITSCLFLVNWKDSLKGRKWEFMNFFNCKTIQLLIGTISIRWSVSYTLLLKMCLPWLCSSSLMNLFQNS